MTMKFAQLSLTHIDTGTTIGGECGKICIFSSINTHCTTLCHTTPHHTTPHHTTPHHTTSHHTTPHHITSHHTTATPQPPATPCHTTQRNISSACCGKYNTGDKNKQSFLCRQFLNLKYHILAENTIPAPMNFGGRIDRGKANIQF